MSVPIDHRRHNLSRSISLPLSKGPEEKCHPKSIIYTKTLPIFHLLFLDYSEKYILAQKEKNTNDDDRNTVKHRKFAVHDVIRKEITRIVDDD